MVETLCILAKKRMVMKVFLFLIVVLFSVQALSQSNQCIDGRYGETALFDSSAIEIDYNEIYATVDHYFTGATMDLQMDVYYPDTMLDPLAERPFILLVHGGSWFNGNKINMAYECMEYARRGFVAATINYRLGWNCDLNNIFAVCGCSNNNLKKAVYCAIQDTRAALRYVYNHANEYHIDTDWMFTGGESAGAINTLQATIWDQAEADDWIPAGFSAEVGGLDDSGNNLPAGFEIKGVIDHCGAVMNLTDMNDNPDLPVIGFHDSNDCVVPYANGQVIGCICSAFYSCSGSSSIYAYRNANGECAELHTVPGSLNHCSFPKPFLVPDASCFLKRVMCGVCTSFSTTDIYAPAYCIGLGIEEPGIAGCTYVDADNYNPLATVDDGSCVYSNSCATDINSDGITNISDLLLFIAEFGSACP